jgi:hypothetical protein
MVGLTRFLFLMNPGEKNRDCDQCLHAFWQFPKMRRFRGRKKTFCPTRNE